MRRLLRTALLSHVDSRLSCVLVLGLLVAIPGMPALSQPRIDHSKADVNGRRGYAVWPYINEMLGDPTGYEAVLARRQQPESWLRFPAGKWQEVPAGEYWVLLEGKFEVSQYPVLLQWSNGPYTGQGLASAIPAVAAGRVHLDGRCPTNRCLAWMLHESSNLEVLPGYFQHEMERWSELDTARKDGVLMPAGRVAAGLYDAARKEFISLQVPLNVPPLRSVAVSPVAPANGRADLILEVARPAITVKQPEKDEKDIDIALFTGDVTRRPTFLVRTHKKIIALWSQVPAGAARVDVSSPTAYLRDKDLRLRSGKVEYVSVNLAPLPKLGVRWSIPDEFKPTEPALKIVNLAGHERINTIQLAKQPNQLEIPVPAAPLEVTLKSGPWSLREAVDLSDGADRSVQLEMHAIHVNGRVYYGDDPVQATITFLTDADPKESLKVRTDTDGKYEALFAKPEAYTAVVDLEGRAAPYPVVGFDVKGDTTIDIRLPGNAYRFRVTRKDDGRPIEGARIVVQNRESTEDSVFVSMRLVTDEQGRATAQPLRSGTVVVSVDADGFVRLTRPEEAVVDKGERDIDLSLEPLGPTDTLTLLLPNGQPAAGANVLVHSDREDRIETADGSGRVAIPRAGAGGLVLVRAAGAAVTARPWRGEDQTWRLDTAREPLVIHAVRADGSSVRAAVGVLWLDGVRLSGRLLAWLTSTGGGTDAAGYWILRNLPARPLQVLFWRSTASNYALMAQQVAQQRFDAMRTIINAPWPATVDVKVLE